MITLLDSNGAFTFKELQSVHQSFRGKTPSGQEVRRSLYALRTSIKQVRLPKAKSLSIAGKKRLLQPTAVVLEGMVDVVVAILDVALVFGFRIDHELARHFPDMCGYCKQPTCICATLVEKPKDRLILENPPDWATTKTVRDFASMLWRIYPKPKTEVGRLKMTLHLAEEILELLEALEEPSNRGELILEAMDVIEKPFDIGYTFGMNIAPLVALRYNNSKHH